MRTVLLKPDQVEEASRVLARAFQNDPLQSYVFPDPLERAALSPAHFAPMLRYGLLAGVVWTTEGSIDGAAIWWPPEHGSIHEDKLEEAGFYELPRVIGEGPFKRFISVIEAVETFHRLAVPGPHWYAMVVGVDPSRQGRGVGGALLAPALAQADSAGVPCYLETTQQRNVAFYQKHGFQVIEQGIEAGSGVPYWTFRR